MTLKKRIGLGALGLLGIALSVFAILLSYEAPCASVDSTAAEHGESMRTVVQDCYGTAEVLHLEPAAKPAPTEHEVLVRVIASSVNPADWHQMTGKPYVMRLSGGFGSPTNGRRGIDFAGRVEAVGASVSRFKVGDEVFGIRSGAFADYISIREDGPIALKPANVSFEQAAAMPVAAVTALQGLRDHGHVKSGDKILINGASGGVGTFAVQIAKSLGAEVTGVCSTRNVEMVRSIGADHVIDYTQDNFTQRSERYDVILDLVGNHDLLEVRRALKPGATLVIIGGPKDDPWLGPAISPIKAMLLAPFIDETMRMFIAEVTKKDLAVLAEWAGSGVIRPVIDRRYALEDITEAMHYLGSQRARGKVIIEIDRAQMVQALDAA